MQSHARDERQSSPFSEAARLQELKLRTIERHGPWTLHNVHLGQGIHTIGEDPLDAEYALKRILQVTADLSDRPLRDLRVLDLACLEGLYAIELARQGARVMAIEGREANLAKARMVKEALGLHRLELVLGDVRQLSAERHGRFDVVYCFGILYHLDAPDVFDFVQRMASVCDRMLVLQTHVSVHPAASRSFRGRAYWGRSVVEHSTGASLEDRNRALWSSLDNSASFWLTRPSLLNLLEDVGFSSIYECRGPLVRRSQDDYVTLVAMRGRPRTVISSPAINAVTAERWPERWRPRVHPAQSPAYPMARRLASLLPRWVKDGLKKAAGLRSGRPAGT